MKAFLLFMGILSAIVTVGLFGVSGLMYYAMGHTLDGPAGLASKQMRFAVIFFALGLVVLGLTVVIFKCRKKVK